MYIGTDDRLSEILLADWGLGDVLVDFDPKREAVFALGETKRGTSIVARYFPGASERRALVIAGVHGSELSGVEVAERLVRRLEAGTKPGFSVLVVPEVFPDNAKIARDATRAGKLRPGADSNLGRITKGFADPNRQFPLPGTDFVLDPTDPKQKKIETENKILLQLIQEFKPERIASVHAKRMEGKARPGLFADPHSWPATALLPDIVAAEQRTVQDATLALAMARHAAAQGARVPGNRLTLTCHKSECPTWHYALPPGKSATSFGEWGPRATPTRRAITVITIEVQHYYPSDPMPKRTPVAPETAAGVANRVKELEAHCDALIALFLKAP
jgi:Succinylglutamate desuccinylase / Aspartoacylase family